MEKLIVCRKKKMGMFLLSCFVILGIVYIYPICFYNLYELIFHNTYPADRNLLDDLLVVLLGVPGSLPWCFIIKEYICILLDIKIKKQKNQQKKCLFNCLKKWMRVLNRRFRISWMCRIM